MTTTQEFRFNLSQLIQLLVLLGGLGASWWSIRETLVEIRTEVRVRTEYELRDHQEFRDRIKALEDRRPPHLPKGT